MFGHAINWGTGFLVLCPTFINFWINNQLMGWHLDFGTNSLLKEVVYFKKYVGSAIFLLIYHMNFLYLICTWYLSMQVFLNNQKGENGLKGTNNNGSIIFDLFQAKYRSTLTCPSCLRQSDTYDPFLSVSLPIQQKNRVPVSVTVHYLKPNYRPVLYGLMMNSSDTVVQLRRTLARKAGIHEKQVRWLQQMKQLGQKRWVFTRCILNIRWFWWFRWI